MRRLVNHLPILLPLLVLAGIAVYAFWLRELPRAEGRITGDFQAAVTEARRTGAQLILAVDQAPY